MERLLINNFKNIIKLLILTKFTSINLDTFRDFYSK